MEKGRELTVILPLIGLLTVLILGLLMNDKGHYYALSNLPLYGYTPPMISYDFRSRKPAIQIQIKIHPDRRPELPAARPERTRQGSQGEKNGL